MEHHQVLACTDTGVWISSWPVSTEEQRQKVADKYAKVLKNSSAIAAFWYINGAIATHQSLRFDLKSSTK